MWFKDINFQDEMEAVLYYYPNTKINYIKGLEGKKK